MVESLGEAFEIKYFDHAVNQYSPPESEYSVCQLSVEHDNDAALSAHEYFEKGQEENATSHMYAPYNNTLVSTGSMLDSVTCSCKSGGGVDTLYQSPSCMATEKESETHNVSCGKKRVKEELGSDGESIPEDGRISKSRKKSGKPLERGRLLACPYHKHDPYGYQDCSKYVLRRIKDVKQHLKRLHKTPDFYCPRCYKTFGNIQDRDCHVRDSNCLNQCNPQFVGVTDEQCKTFELYTGRRKSLEDQWFIIWDTVFPGIGPPASPFVGSSQTEAVSLLREIWNQDQSEMISSIVDGSSCASGQSSIKSIMERLLDRLEMKTVDLESLSRASAARNESLRSNSTATTATGIPKCSCDVPGSHQSGVEAATTADTDYSVLPSGCLVGSNDIGITPEELVLHSTGDELMIE